MNRLDLAGCKLAICLGPGGVGKTTISAALAIDGACGGRAVDVMTVNPAPRLLDALGLNAGASEPREVELDSIAPAAGSVRRGRLRALRLDPRSTFDAIVRRYAATPAAAEAIISGRIYANLASAFAGVADYMAMEKLLELAAEPATDLIVLDTPPAAEALDFLDAPRRLLGTARLARGQPARHSPGTLRRRDGRSRGARGFVGVRSGDGPQAARRRADVRAQFRGHVRRLRRTRKAFQRDAAR